MLRTVRTQPVWQVVLGGVEVKSIMGIVIAQCVFVFVIIVLGHRFMKYARKLGGFICGS